MNINLRIMKILRKQGLRLAVLMALVSGSAACASAVVPQTGKLEPKTNNCDPGKITVSEVHWFKDSEGAWRVIGMMRNNSDQAIGSMDTGVETRTKDDMPADQGEDVSEYPLNLLPGSESPYISWIKREIPNLDHFEVEINDCAVAEPTQRGSVDLQAGQVVVDKEGIAQVTAEIVNTNKQTVVVNGMMAAVFDGKGKLVMADYANVTPRDLAPGESGPVRASLELPAGASSAIKSFKLYMDVLIEPPVQVLVNGQKDVQISGSYTDQEGHFHLLGELTNRNSQPVMTAVQASVYADSSRKTLLDAAQYNTWVPVGAGKTVPFDMDTWGALNHLTDPMTGTSENITIRVEPFLTFVSSAPPGKLTVMDPQASFSKGEATFSGKVRNDSGAGISAGLVQIIVRQKADGKLMAVGDAHLDITDSAAPGAILDYSLTVPLPLNLKPEEVETEISAQGFMP